MRILGLETSAQDATVALLLDGHCHELDIAAAPGTPASDRLLAVVAELLATHGVDKGTLDAIAFSAGPGAFTGVRVACSVAQGYGLALGVPVVPVSTLEALAACAPDGPVVCALDARMGELYLGRFQVAAGSVPSQEGELQCLAAGDVPPCGWPEWQGLGNGFAVGGDALLQALGGRALSIDAEARPRAGMVARLGALKFAAGQAIDPAEVAPIYVRNKVAKTTAERLAEGLKA